MFVRSRFQMILYVLAYFCINAIYEVYLFPHAKACKGIFKVTKIIENLSKIVPYTNTNQDS